MDAVAEQARAYNDHDLDRFLACYTDDALLEELDGTQLMRGIEDMRTQYAVLFREYPQVTATITTTIELGSYTVYEEVIDGLDEPRRGVAIYHRTDDQIDRVVFVGWH